MTEGALDPLFAVLPGTMHTLHSQLCFAVCMPNMGACVCLGLCLRLCAFL